MPLMKNIGANATTVVSIVVITGLYEKLEYRNEEYDTFDASFTKEAEAEIDNLFVD